MNKKRALGFKPLACKGCGEIVQKVDLKADSILCSKCVQKELNGGFSMNEEEYWDAVRAGKIVSCKKGEDE
jgi:hypothetical protein